MDIYGISGVEFSCDFNGVGIHILALFLKSGHYDKIKEFLKKTKVRKEESNKLLANRLKENGYDISSSMIKTVF